MDLQIEGREVRAYAIEDLRYSESAEWRLLTSRLSTQLPGPPVSGECRDVPPIRFRTDLFCERLGGCEVGKLELWTAVAILDSDKSAASERLIRSGYIGHWRIVYERLIESSSRRFLPIGRSQSRARLPLSPAHETVAEL
jgi:hypothetical protein